MNFRRMLDPEELRLFEEKCVKENAKWHKTFNDEWKKAKKKKGVEENAEEECQRS